MNLKERKEKLDEDLRVLKEALAKKEREAEKLSAVQTHLLEHEPVPGSVLMFSRHLAGSTHKYTFVVFRGHDSERSWVVTGRDNSIQLLGLKNSGNTWEEILFAVGSAKLKQAVSWVPFKGVKYEYYVGATTGAYYRGNLETLDVELLMGREWKPSHEGSLPRIRNSFGYRSVSEDEVLSYIRRRYGK